MIIHHDVTVHVCTIFVKISFIYLKISVYFLYFDKFNQNVLDHPIHGGGGVGGALGGVLGAHLVRRRTSLNLY